ncbi:hypothetical protein Tco_1266072 [Tanacetum coccineum]
MSIRIPQVVQPPAYQAPAYQAPAPQIQGVSKEDFHSYVKANDACDDGLATQFQFPADFVVVVFVPAPSTSTSSRGAFLKTMSMHFNRCITGGDNPSFLARGGHYIPQSGQTAQLHYLIQSFYFFSKHLISIRGTSDFLPFRMKDSLDSFLALEDDTTSPEVNPTYYDPEGGHILSKAILKSEPLPTLQGKIFSRHSNRYEKFVKQKP